MLALAISCGGTPALDPRCADLRPLSEAVRRSGLTEAQVQCLETRVGDPADPSRSEVSALLVWDARRLDDGHATWRARAERHLTIDSEDLQVRLQLARHRQREGPSGAEASLKLAEEGFATEAASDPQAQHDLWKIKAIAAEMLAPPNAPADTRIRTAAFARSWYRAAVAADQPTEWPYAMCTNAGQTEAYCTGSATPQP